MSQLKTILDTFESRQDIDVFHKSEDAPFADYLRMGEMAGTAAIGLDSYDFWIAPRQGIFDVDKLQEFMMGLFPGLKPFKMDAVTPDLKYRRMKAGCLYFDEEIGESEVKLKTRILDEELYVEGKEVVETEDTETHARSIHVKVFPHRDAGLYVLAEGCGWGNIPLRQVRKVQRSKQPGFKQGFLERLADLWYSSQVF